MIPLHVKGIPVLAVGEGGRIAEDQIKAVKGIPEIVDAVASVEEVTDIGGLSVELEVFHGPVQIGGGGIDAGR